MTASLSILIAVNLKMYLSAQQTRAWVREVAEFVAHRHLPSEVEVAVLPSFPLLESTAATLTGTSIRWGAQDVAARDVGAQTGEVSGAVLAELGCRYVEVGHAERRRMFAEGSDTLIDKTRRVIEAGMVPIYCTGEQIPTERPTAAIRACLSDLDGALTIARTTAQDPQFVVAYEPVWAIGADQPAPAQHVATVCAALRDAARAQVPATRVIYGGSAGPGTWAALGGSTDGLFLGRFAHDSTALADVIDEVLGCSATRAAAATTTSKDYP